MADYQNWNQEREGVIDDTLGILRDQRDQEQDLVLKGFVDINSYVFNLGKYFTSSVTFESSFAQRPNIQFAEIAPTSLPVQTGSVQASGPLIVFPFVQTWTMDAANFAGFTLGVYALTTPPATSSMVTISWVAMGTGPPYMDRNTAESWQEPYDYDDTEFMTENTREPIEEL